MQLVPSDLHDAYKHTGGRADIKSSNWFTKAGAALSGFFAPRYSEAQASGGDTNLGLLQDATTYLPVVGDGIGLATEGVEAADRNLKQLIHRPNSPKTWGNIHGRLKNGEDIESILDNP